MSTDEAEPITADEKPLSRAERRRQARGRASDAPEKDGPVPFTPDELAELMANAEEMPPEEAPEQDDVPPTMTDQILIFGETVRALTKRGIPSGTAVKLVEVVLMYDVNRRNLQLQEMAQMGSGFATDGMPPGARRVTPEELAAMNDEGNTEPLEPEVD